MASPLGKRESVTSDDAAAEKALSFAAFSASLEKEVGRKQADAAELFAKEDVDAGALQTAVHEMLSSVNRVMVEAGHTLQDTMANSTRKQLKAQANMFALKLETARTAASVEMTNQKTEMQAEHHRALEEKVQQLSSGGDELLREAHAKQEELQTKINGLTVSNKSVEEKLMSVEKLLKASEAKAAKIEAESAERIETAEHEAQTLREEAETAKAQLDDAMKDLEGTKSENKTLGEQVGELVSAYNTAKASASDLAKRLEELEKGKIGELEEMVSNLMGKLREAAAEAERASLMHAEECKRLTAEMAGRLKKEIEAAQRGEREAAEAQLERLLGELRSMGEKHAELEGEIRGVLDKLRKKEEEMDAVREEMRRKEAAAALAGASSGEELLVLKEKLGAMTAELQSVKSELHNTMSNLDIKIDENMSLGEQVRRLIQDYEQAKSDITNGKQQLQAALADLNFTKDENMTLGEQIRKLVNEYEAAKNEMALSQSQLADALKEVGVLSTDKRSLSEQVRDLLGKFEELKKANIEGIALKKEIAEIKKTLREALGSIHTLSNDKRTLAEQVNDLLANYKQAKDSLDQAEREIESLRRAGEQFKQERARILNEANSRIERIRDESIRERNQLVQAALKSLNELRTHVQYTASGVRVSQPLNDSDNEDEAAPPAFLTWDHPSRWGAKPRNHWGEKPQEMLISLHQPAVPPLDVKPKPRYIRPRTGSPTSPRGRVKPGNMSQSPRVRRAQHHAAGYLNPIGRMAEAVDKLPPRPETARW